MKKKKYILSIIISIFVTIVIAYVLLTVSSYLLCLNTVKQLPAIKKQEFLRVKVYGSTYSETGNTISAIFSLMDSSENEIATIERSWSGSYLAVEFAEVKIQDKIYTFPSKIYSKNKIIQEKEEVKRGTNLEKYYNFNNQCMLFTKGYTVEDRRNFYRLSKYATEKYPLFNLGQIRTYSVDLSNCKPYKYYSVWADSKGKVYVSEI